MKVFNKIQVFKKLIFQCLDNNSCRYNDAHYDVNFNLSKCCITRNLFVFYQLKYKWKFDHHIRNSKHNILFHWLLLYLSRRTNLQCVKVMENLINFSNIHKFFLLARKCKKNFQKIDKNIMINIQRIESKVSRQIFNKLFYKLLVSNCSKQVLHSMLKIHLHEFQTIVSINQPKELFLDFCFIFGVKEPVLKLQQLSMQELPK